LNHDGFDENMTFVGERNIYNRKETVSGAYAQYTWNLDDKLIVLAGVRGDYSTLYDFL
jgi:outer membrane receptor protein involved in Fe transport